MITIIIQAFVTVLGLAAAIGAQSTFVLNQSLSNQYLLMTFLICWLADSVLFLIGIFGMGSILMMSPLVTTIMTWAAVVFLVGYGLMSLVRANTLYYKTELLSTPKSFKSTLLMLLAVTFLNPHVYLDSIVIMSSLTSDMPFSGKASFAAGALLATLVWFSSLILGARLLSPLLKKTIARRIIDLLIGLLMFWIAWSLI